MVIDVERVERVSHVKMTPSRLYLHKFILIWSFLMVSGFTTFILLFEGAKSVHSDVEQVIKTIGPIQEESYSYKQNGFRKSCALGHKSIEHENLRRSLFDGVLELLYSIDGHFSKIKNVLTTEAEGIDINHVIANSINDLRNQLKYVLKEAHLLAEVDDAEEWRRKELKKFSLFVQNRISALQNPKNCSVAVPKVVCDLSKKCGFGCQLHHATYCLMIAFATNRTLLINSTNWAYSEKGWESVFQPVSNTCSFEEDSIKNYISLPIIDEFDRQDLLDYLPQHIPTELSEKLRLLHSNPSVWWISQFIHYLMRYQYKVDDEIEILKSEMNFTNPIVGVHIRRTDKIGTEAVFHSVEEYMRHVEDWFEVTAMKSHDKEPLDKKIYLATDDSTVFEEIRNKYPDYRILFNPLSASSAQVDKRYSESSLIHIIQDVHFLSQSSYIVCTFSSQVCRMAYELMQSVWPGDAGNRFKSLDDVYYFGGQKPCFQRAILEHKPVVNGSKVEKEIELWMGDLIIPLGNHWNGYSKGTNSRTLETGLYPSFKVKNELRLINYSLLMP